MRRIDPRILFRSKVGKALLAGVVLAVLAFVWLKAQYAHPAEVGVTRQFIALLRAEEYRRAYELTLKDRMWGLRGEAFETYARRQFCGKPGNFGMTEIFPFQSNGNRLRRRFNGVDPDMREVHIEYENGLCHGRVTLRRNPVGEWRVYQFGSHSW